MVILTDQERQKFSDYCLFVSQTNDDMAKNIEQNLSGEIGKLMSERERKKATAYALVGTDLINAEKIEIKGQ